MSFLLFPFGYSTFRERTHRCLCCGQTLVSLWMPRVIPGTEPPRLRSYLWDVERLTRSLRMHEDTKQLCRKLRANNHGNHEPDQRVLEILRRPRLVPNTPEWEEARTKVLTSTSMPGLLGQNPYADWKSVYRQKTFQTEPFHGNDATEHGHWHEAEAAAIYEHLTGLKLIDDIGLLLHPFRKHGEPRFGATPDFISTNGLLIEVKCPYRRIIKPGVVPLYYQAQIQMQMEVTGLDVVHFVQYVPTRTLTSEIEFRDEYSQGRFDITVVHRDPTWWKTNFPIFDAFWDLVVDYFRQHNAAVGEKRDDLIWKPSEKKSNSIVQCSVPKEPCGIINQPRSQVLSATIFVADMKPNNDITTDARKESACTLTSEYNEPTCTTA